MSGERLCTVLTELGFDRPVSLDLDSFDWPFQYEETRPLLEWICSNLRPSNILSPFELSQYKQFVKEGKLLELFVEPPKPFLLSIFDIVS